ncbi:MAG TPA: hypothetical protein VLK28_13610 [Methylomirabilota bacterium]|nr:hypothetical protein [Methylomirabilota bacterium]
MSLFAAAVALVAAGICLLFAWVWRQAERGRIERQWVERERLLDRRFRPASAREVLQRRARRA